MQGSINTATWDVTRKQSYGGQSITYMRQYLGVINSMKLSDRTRSFGWCVQIGDFGALALSLHTVIFVKGVVTEKNDNQPFDIDDYWINQDNNGKDINSGCLFDLLPVFVSCNIPAGYTPSAQNVLNTTFSGRPKTLTQNTPIRPKIRRHGDYRKTSCISRTKSQNLNVSHLLVQWSLPNPLKPGVNLRMKV